MRRRAGWVVVGACLLLTPSCSTPEVVGTPAATVLTKEDLFEPCKIPDASLQSVGLDPKTVAKDFLGVPDPLWQICRWTGSWYFVSILSTTHTFAEVRSNPHSVNFQPAAIPGRQATTYSDVDDPDGDVCDVAFPTSKGVVILRAATFSRHAIERDPCAVATETVIALNALIPN